MILVRCKTCGLDLIDKWFVDGLGELPRPHHEQGEECPKEDPDWSTETRHPNFPQRLEAKPSWMERLKPSAKGFHRMIVRLMVTLLPAGIAVQFFREGRFWFGVLFLGPLVFEVFRMGMFDRRTQAAKE